MPSGYPAPPLTVVCQNPSQACWGKAIEAEEAVSEVRVSRSRVGGFRGCSLTTSWLQRLARGILSNPGRRRACFSRGGALQWQGLVESA
jgi:hypothetical protein